MTDRTVFITKDSSAWRVLKVETANSTYTVALHHDGSRCLAVLRGYSGATSREIEIHDTEASLDDGRSLFDTNPWGDWQGHSLIIGSMQTSEVVRVSTEGNAALCNSLTSTYAGMVQSVPPLDESAPGATFKRTAVLGVKNQPAIGDRSTAPSSPLPASGKPPSPVRMQATGPKKPRRTPKISSVSPGQLVELLERAKSGLHRYCEYKTMRVRIFGDPELRKRFDEALAELIPIAQKAMSMTDGSK